MRALITLIIVLSCGAAAMVLSSRASKAVDAKVGGGAASAVASTNLTRLEVMCYTADGTLAAKVTVKHNEISFTGAEQSPRIDAADWAEIEAAFAAARKSLWRTADEQALKGWNKEKGTGGDFYWAEFGPTAKQIARADGWRASDLDEIKEAIWRVIRRRERPALVTDRKILSKLPKGEYFVEPFQTLRDALRIKF
ncbi:MAG: hypothetical protein ACYTGX_03070 [Planctomycetota bacterium]|jgi:hypothetical protein